MRENVSPPRSSSSSSSSHLTYRSPGKKAEGERRRKKRFNNGGGAFLSSPFFTSPLSFPPLFLLFFQKPSYLIRAVASEEKERVLISQKPCLFLLLPPPFPRLNISSGNPCEQRRAWPECIPLLFLPSEDEEKCLDLRGRRRRRRRNKVHKSKFLLGEFACEMLVVVHGQKNPFRPSEN